MIYRLYGLTLASDFPFANKLVPSEGGECATGDEAPDLEFICTNEPPLTTDWELDTATYRSPERADNGQSFAYFYQRDTYDVLRFTDIADFYLWPERIVCHLYNPGCDYLVEILLLGSVLSCWLEQQGIPVLHASAVSIKKQAVSFLSGRFGGKTALAATLMAAGHPLLTDDILPVEHVDGLFLGRPGYPTMRMWPEEAEHFLGSCEPFDLVHPELAKRRIPVGADGFGTFCSTAQPLACVYLPERREGAEPASDIEFRSIPPRESAIELVRHSFTPRVVEAIGLQPQRLRIFAQMVQQVPVRRLVYPSDFLQLPRVGQAVLKDLDGLRLPS